MYKFLQISPYKYIKSKVGRFISLERRRLLGSPSFKKKKKFTNFTAFQFSFQNFQCGSFLMTLYLPHGVKKAKGRTESHLLLHKSRPILKWGSWSSKKKIYSLTDKRQYSPTITIHAAPHPTLHCMDQNLYFSCHVFHVTVQLTKKEEEENSNPGHFALAVTDKLQTRRRGKVGGSF